MTTIALTSAYNGIHVIDTVTHRDHHLPGEGFSLDWSPDGRWLAYVDPKSNFARPLGWIYIQKTDGSAPAVLQTGTSGLDSSPSWSPDGRRIAFAATQGTVNSKRRSVYVIDLDGSHRTLVARNGSYPAWSPDGTKIAYHARCGGGVKLVTPTGQDVTPAHGTSRCVSIGVAGAPTWSPDGTKIAMSNSGGTYVVNVDGTHLVRRTGQSANGFFGTERPAWQPLR